MELFKRRKIQEVEAKSINIEEKILELEKN